MKKFIILLLASFAIVTGKAQAATEEYIAEPAQYVWAEPLHLTENYNSKLAVCHNRLRQNHRYYSQHEQKAWRFTIPQRIVEKLQNQNANITLLFDRLEIESFISTDIGTRATASIFGNIYIMTQQGADTNGYVTGQIIPKCTNNNEAHKTAYSHQKDCSVNAYSVNITPGEIPNLDFNDSLSVYVVIDTERTVNCNAYPGSPYGGGSPARTAQASVTVDFNATNNLNLVVSYEEEENDYQNVCDEHIIGSPEHGLTGAEMCNGMCNINMVDETPMLMGQSEVLNECEFGGGRLALWISICEQDYFRSDPTYGFWDFYFDNAARCGWSSPCDIEGWQVVVPPDENDRETCEITCEYDPYLDEQFCNVDQNKYNDIEGDEQTCTDEHYNAYLRGNMSTYQFCLDCDENLDACINAHCPGQVGDTTEAFCSCLYADGQGRIVDTQGYNSCIGIDCDEKFEAVNEGLTSVREYCTSCRPTDVSGCEDDFCPPVPVLHGLFTEQLGAEQGLSIPYSYEQYLQYLQENEGYCTCIHAPNASAKNECMAQLEVIEPCHDYHLGTISGCKCRDTAQYPGFDYDTCIDDACGDLPVENNFSTRDEFADATLNYCTCMTNSTTDLDECMANLIP